MCFQHKTFKKKIPFNSMLTDINLKNKDDININKSSHLFNVIVPAYGFLRRFRIIWTPSP